MSMHDITGQRCRAVMCTTFATRQSCGFGLDLCQEHMLLAWMVIQQDIEAGTRPLKPKRDLVPGAKPEMPSGYVYYLRVGDMIKIGHSRNVDDRLAVYPPKSELIAVREGTRKFERAEHLRYADHLEYGREWFTYSDELRDDIRHEDDTRPPLTGLGDDPWFEEGDDEELRPLWQRHRAAPTPKVEYGRKAS